MKDKKPKEHYSIKRQYKYHEENGTWICEYCGLKDDRKTVMQNHCSFKHREKKGAI